MVENWLLHYCCIFFIMCCLPLSRVFWKKNLNVLFPQFLILHEFSHHREIFFFYLFAIEISEYCGEKSTNLFAVFSKYVLV